MNYFTVVLYNGICNRLLPLISILRLAKKVNKKVNIQWVYTPVRSCLTYYGDFCKFEDLFEHSDDILIGKEFECQNNYDFPFWESKKYIIDSNSQGNTHVNLALYTVISTNDNSNSIFANLKYNISFSREIIFDQIGIELSNTFKTLQPKKELQSEINTTYSKFNTNMVGIHVRKSDGGFVNFDWKNMIPKLINECKKWSDKDINNGVYLATDDEETYKEFQKVIGNKLIFYNPPPRLGDQIFEHKFENNKFNILCAIIDIYLLGKCNSYIVGTCESTFSICGMLLSNENTKKYLINNPDLIPEFV